MKKSEALADCKKDERNRPRLLQIARRRNENARGSCRLQGEGMKTSEALAGCEKDG